MTATTPTPTVDTSAESPWEGFRAVQPRFPAGSGSSAGWLNQRGEMMTTGMLRAVRAW
jgi:hypothetical protein